MHCLFGIGACFPRSSLGGNRLGSCFEHHKVTAVVNAGDLTSVTGADNLPDRRGVRVQRRHLIRFFRIEFVNLGIAQ